VELAQVLHSDPEILGGTPVFVFVDTTLAGLRPLLPQIAKAIENVRPGTILVVTTAT
jgi:hypothetical protein